MKEVTYKIEFYNPLHKYWIIPVPSHKAACIFQVSLLDDNNRKDDRNLRNLEVM
jgi:hypothetical protein